jgi:hypothetical protein
MGTEEHHTPLPHRYIQTFLAESETITRDGRTIKMAVRKRVWSRVETFPTVEEIAIAPIVLICLQCTLEIISVLVRLF